MEFNLADLFERAVDRFGDREAVVAGPARRTFAELEERANRMAHHLRGAGVGPGDHVAVYAYNVIEWVETMIATYKIRAVCVNVNFRYVAAELAYLLDNAAPVAMVFQRRFTDRVADVAPKVTSLRHLVVVEDGTDPADADAESLGAARYEEALAAAPPGRDFGPRSGGDHYLLYTGGTTGMPKGVLWRQEDVIFALGGGIDLISGEVVTRPEEMADKGADSVLTSLPIAPLMHGATQWSLNNGLSKGQRTVLVDSFEPAEVWRLVEAERVNMVMITGDAMARPLLETLDAALTAGVDLSSLYALSSTAALFSPALKEAFMERLGVVVTDGVGASEAGSHGVSMTVKGQAGADAGVRVKAIADALVVDESLNPLPVGEIGRLARKGHIPIGYLGDPVKTAEVFRTGPDGTRYSVPGDFARLEEDGRITLLGRGSAVINSGGEKIFPEEVEGVLKTHPGVYDAIVTGAPHRRWGETVAAVVQPRPGAAPTLGELQAHCRASLAGYKVPRVLRLVDATVRTPSGKADLVWARRQAAEAARAAETETAETEAAVGGGGDGAGGKG
ncbi:acyl-CoA synthetase [Frankia sp. CNm7]|uniref:Acyl-CoA synthetase n=1 Tax=Frankia nepalensis TaxID=1836974 RepID=A0A937UPQ6_9ACTN|nr:acyl-CoA synthetase [Frankia nepalensis]MBL7496507.1 acyl-CoA synthetase [Frankia nepalensis]MBL7511350.1 acyl-CoA synthetase [Frankia nepalensis]MBL7521146.1 acyl-CoA synthetase [Frankia nepalensis]MBL7627480.1 acyl-CoA synthetase [Frankia nepalensis]